MLKILMGTESIDFLDKFNITLNDYQKIVLKEEEFDGVKIETVMNPFNCNITTYVNHVPVNKVIYWKDFPENARNKKAMVSHITSILENPEVGVKMCPIKSFNPNLAATADEFNTFLKILKEYKLFIPGGAA